VYEAKRETTRLMGMTGCTCLRERERLPCPTPGCPGSVDLPRGYYEAADGRRWRREVVRRAGGVSAWAWVPWEPGPAKTVHG
jgi:hypothetical protein